MVFSGFGAFLRTNSVRQTPTMGPMMWSIRLCLRREVSQCNTFLRHLEKCPITTHLKRSRPWDPLEDIPLEDLCPEESIGIVEIPSTSQIAAPMLRGMMDSFCYVAIVERRDTSLQSALISLSPRCSRGMFKSL